MSCKTDWGVGDGSGARREVPPSRETFWIVSIAAIGGVVLFILAHFYSAVWIDEICYTDPAANLAAGRGFVSSVWAGQPANRFFAANTPLHPLILAGAFKVFGFHREVVQALNIALFTVAATMAWLAVRRMGWIESAGARICFFTTVLFSSSGFYAAGFGRYDPVGMLAVAVALFLWSGEKSKAQLLGLVLMGMVIVWSGLQMALYVAILALLGAILWSWKSWGRFALLGCGLGIGFFGLRALYLSQGVIDIYVREMFGKRREGLIWDPNMAGGFIDWTFFILWLAIIVVGMGALRRGIKSPVVIRCGWALAMGLIISWGMWGISRFPLYYAWMAVVPMAAGVIGAIDTFPDRRARSVLLAGVTLLAAAWLPVWAVIGHRIAPQRDLAAASAFVNRNLAPGETAVCDFTSYYAAFVRAERVYSDWYVKGTPMRPGQKEAVDVIITRPAVAPELMNILGGEWVRLPESFGGDAGALPLNCWPYRLEVWRRRGNAFEIARLLE